MDIRRVEPELILPTVASDRGARVASDQPREQLHDKRTRRPRKDAPADEAEHTDEGGLPVTYDPEGRLHEPELPEVESHNIDFHA